MNNEMIKAESNSEEIYTSIRSYVINAQNRVYTAVNSAIRFKAKTLDGQDFFIDLVFYQRVPKD